MAICKIPHSISTKNSSEESPFCFYLDKEKIKCLCISSPKNVELLKSGQLIMAQLYLLNKEHRNPEETGYISENGIHYYIDQNTLITKELSGLPFEILIMAGEYGIDKEGLVHLLIGLP